MIHYDIPLIKTYVEDKYLYDMDEEKANKFTPCELICVSSYPENALTFQALINGSALFSYLPPTAFNSKGESNETALSLDDLVYKNCPSDKLTVNKFANLDKEVYCFFKKPNTWIKGDYLMTLDWYDDNEQFHLISLYNGQIAALPNHKVLFGERTDLPDYKKLRQEWKVTR